MATNVQNLQRPSSKKEEFIKIFAVVEESLRNNMPQNVNKDRLIAVARAAVVSSPEILDADLRSTILAINYACQMGLEVNSLAAQAYLVPRRIKGVVMTSLMIAYRGYITLARRSKQILDIESRIVSEQDKFTLSYTETGTVLRHEPYIHGNPGKMIGVYAKAILPGHHGSGPISHIEFMRADEIMAIKNNAPSGSPWNGPHWLEMARKTPVRRLAKYLDLTPDFALAVEADDGVFTPIEGTDIQAAVRGQSLIHRSVDDFEESTPAVVVSETPASTQSKETAAAPEPKVSPTPQPRGQEAPTPTPTPAQAKAPAPAEEPKPAATKPAPAPAPQPEPEADFVDGDPFDF